MSPGALEEGGQSQGAGGCCDTPSWPCLPSCPSSRSSFPKCCVRLPPGGVSFCSSCGRRMLLAGSSSLLPAATPQGQGVQAPVAVTQGPGTCCGAKHREAGAPAPALHPTPRHPPASTEQASPASLLASAPTCLDRPGQMPLG